MSATVVRFEPRGAALELFKRTEGEICLSGAAGTGKSVAVLMKLHLSCLNTPGVRALVVRKTHASLTASTLVTFRKMVAAESLAAGLVHWYGGSGAEPASFRYSNGSVLVVGGLDRASRLLSTEYDLCFIDEAIEVSEEDLDTIVTRLRHGKLSRQQLLLATNPGPPNHHLKVRADAGRCVMLYSKHEDNPRMFDGGDWTAYGRDYLARLDTLTGARYQRMRWGKWVASEGQVYEGWDESVHVVDRFEVPEDWPAFLSVDFGYTNPFCAQFWREDPDGRLYLTTEIYATGGLVEDHARQIRSIIGQREPHPRMVVCDHDAEDRATLHKHLGMGTVAAKKSVSDGIQAVQARLRVQGDGKPRLFVVKGATVKRDAALAEAGKPTCTQDEIPGYVWAVKPGGDLKEEPLKLNDHGCDALRYMVAQRDLRGRPNIRWL